MSEHVPSVNSDLEKIETAENDYIDAKDVAEALLLARAGRYEQLADLNRILKADTRDTFGRHRQDLRALASKLIDNPELKKDVELLHGRLIAESRRSAIESADEANQNLESCSGMLLINVDSSVEQPVYKPVTGFVYGQVADLHVVRTLVDGNPYDHQIKEVYCQIASLTDVELEAVKAYSGDTESI